jgi:hypothetical protein
MIKTFFTFLLLLSLLVDLFDLENDFFSTLLFGSLSVDSNITSTSLVFVKSVKLPITFMNLSCWIISKLSIAPTLFSVVITLALASLALYSLIHHFVLFPEQEDVKNAHDCPCSQIILNINNPVKPKPKTTPNLKRKSELDISTLPREESKRKRHRVDCSMDSCMNLEDLFKEHEPVFKPDIITPQRRLSYADAVGYANMEQKIPRNPTILNPYDFNLEFLFVESDNNSSENAIHLPELPTMHLEVDHGLENQQNPHPYFINLEELFKEVEPIHKPLSIATNNRRLSYAEAVGYEHMEQKVPRNPTLLNPYDFNLEFLFVEQLVINSSENNTEDLPLLLETEQTSDCDSHLMNLEYLFQEFKEESNPKRRLSYADAVGYANMEQKVPRNPTVLNPYDFNLEFLFVETSSENTRNFPLEIEPPSLKPERRLSYSEAVEFSIVNSNSFVNDDCTPKYETHAWNLKPTQQQDTFVFPNDGKFSSFLQRA